MPSNIDITVQSQLDQQILTSHGNENAKQLIQESNNPYTGNLDTQKLSSSLAAIAEQDRSLAEPLIQAVQQELESTNSFDAAHFAKDMQKQLSWLGEQYIGVSKGAADMLLDTAKGLGTLAVGAVKHYADTSPAGLVFDGLKGTGVIPDSLPLPSYKASQETSGEIIDVSKAITNNPGLILEAITEPIVKRWTEERYGEAIGYAGMEIASLILTPTKLAKLGKLSNLTKLTTVDELAGALSLAKELNKQVPGDLVSHFDELVSAKRASGELDLVVEAARKSDTLPELLNSGKLTQAELGKLAGAGKLSLEELVPYEINSKTISQSFFDEILLIKKGQRPEPSKYLSKEYMDAHAVMFNDGAARIEPSAPTGKIGRTETWVLPKNTAQEAIVNANGSPRKLEELLGLDNGYLGDNPVLIDIPKISGYRIPTGNEFAAYDDFWRPGGFTHPGGLPEAVIDPILPGSYTVKKIF